MDEPIYRDVAYGDHERDVVDLYQADSEGPTPVYVYIHGGGFRGGDKAGISQVLLKGCLEAEGEDGCAGRGMRGADAGGCVRGEARGDSGAVLQGDG